MSVRAWVSLCVFQGTIALCIVYVCKSVSLKGQCVGKGPEVLVHPGERTGPKPYLTPPPLPSPSPCAVMGCLRGWRFPWQREPGEEGALCALRVMQNGLLKAGGGPKVISGGTGVYTSKVNNSQLLHTTRLCFWVFFLSLSNQHKTLIKTATPAKWTSICIYMLCKIRANARVWIHLDVAVLNASNSHV